MAKCEPDTQPSAFDEQRDLVGRRALYPATNCPLFGQQTGRRDVLLRQAGRIRASKAPNGRMRAIRFAPPLHFALGLRRPS